MIETRCGLLCACCEYVKDPGCNGCIATDGNPFHGMCQLAACCQERGNLHCGECGEFPCDLLERYSYDKANGDNGKRIKQCRSWNEGRDELNYPWLYDYLLDKRGVIKDFKLEWQWMRYLIGDKMYAAVCKDDKGQDKILTLKLEPLHGDTMRKQYHDITPGYYMNKVHWNSVNLKGKVPDAVLKDMIDCSYQLVFQGLSKKKQREIEV